MTELRSTYIEVDHGPNGVGFAANYCGRIHGKLFTLATSPTHEGAYAAALIEADRKGGLEIVDKIGGAA